MIPRCNSGPQFSGPRIKVGEHAGGIQFGNKSCYIGIGGKSGGGLIKVDHSRVARYNVRNGFGNLNAIVELPVTVTGLKQNADVIHNLIICISSAGDYVHGGYNLFSLGRTKSQIAYGKSDGFSFLI